MDEIFKQLEENKNYKVSNLGNVINSYRREFMTPIRTSKNHGYYRVHIAGRLYLLHRLVAKYFIPNPENKPCVNHIDGDKSNNSVNNLEWVTVRENEDHAVKNGLKSHGEGRHNAKIKIDSLKEIFSMRERGMSYKEIARTFGVTHHSIFSIIKGRGWRHYTVPMGLLKENVQ